MIKETYIDDGKMSYYYYHLIFLLFVIFLLIFYGNEDSGVWIKREDAQAHGCQREREDLRAWG